MSCMGLSRSLLTGGLKPKAQAGLVITLTKGTTLSRYQFCSDLAEFFSCFSKHMTQLFFQGIGTNNISKEVIEFLNLVKLCLTPCEAAGYYERKLIF